ncbi:S-type pyocin domain-containing protein [Photorhabdus sp. SF281]|uniref:S-type pyocin domain-containing protein n=1 Tax=Photorhabdus sp. SF281 TaxID=3459527 RepID=UPI0040446CC3
MEDSMTVTANGGGWNYGGPEGNGNQRDGGGNSRHVDPRAQVLVSPYSVHPLTLELINNKWGFTFNTTEVQNEVREALRKAIESLNDTKTKTLDTLNDIRTKAAPYTTSVSNFAVRAAPYLGRLATTFGALYPTTMGDATLSTHDPDGWAAAIAQSRFEKNQRSALMVMKATMVTKSPLNTTALASITNVPVEVQVKDIINNDQKRQLAITRTINKTVNVPVVKAEKVSNFSHGIYTAKIIPDAPPVHIKMDTSKIKQPRDRGFGGFGKKNKVNENAPIESYLPVSGLNTHDAIVYFEDGKHEPIYVSMTKILTKQQERKQIEETLKREQEWKAKHPAETAIAEYFEAGQELDVINIDYQEKQKPLNQLLNSPEGRTLSDPVKYPLVYEQTKKQLEFTKGEIKVNDKDLINILLQQGKKAYFNEIVRREREKSHPGLGILMISALYERLGIRLYDAHQKIEQTKQELTPIVESRNKAENKKKSAEQKLYNSGLLTRKGLENIADKNGTISVPVRYRFVNDPASGELTHGAYHTTKENGLDQVPVRYMHYNAQLNRYEFSIDDDANKPSILWTPADPGFRFPNHTGYHIPLDIPSTPLVTPIPEPIGINIEIYPMPEPRGLKDYILVTPIPGIPAIYVYFKRPAVKFLEVESYDDFQGRPRDGYHADHIPSAAAVKLHLKRKNPDMDLNELEKRSKQVAAIIIPTDVHRKISETYGGRNKAKMEEDSLDLEKAVDRNFDVIKGDLKKYGATEEKLEAARNKIHEINRKFGLY